MRVFLVLAVCLLVLLLAWKTVNFALLVIVSALATFMMVLGATNVYGYYFRGLWQWCLINLFGTLAALSFLVYFSTQSRAALALGVCLGFTAGLGFYWYEKPK